MEGTKYQISGWHKMEGRMSQCLIIRNTRKSERIDPPSLIIHGLIESNFSAVQQSVFLPRRGLRAAIYTSVVNEIPVAECQHYTLGDLNISVQWACKIIFSLSCKPLNCWKNYCTDGKNVTAHLMPDILEIIFLLLMKWDMTLLVACLVYISVI